MNSHYTYSLLSEGVLGVAETSTRRGSVSVRYGDELYACCRPTKAPEAGVEV